MAKKTIDKDLTTAEAMEIKSTREAFADAPKPVPEKKVKEVKHAGSVTGCTDLNVRESADKNSSALCQIRVNAPVEILEELEDWYKVKTVAGVVGYCMKQYIK